MPPEAVKAQRAIQKLAEKAIRLAVFDEIAAITRTRPLEQIADCSRYGWGGTCYQLDPERVRLNVIGMYNGLMTLAQSGYHPRRGECLAQRNVRRENRKTVFYSCELLDRPRAFGLGRCRSYGRPRGHPLDS